MRRIDEETDSLKICIYNYILFRSNCCVAMSSWLAL